MSVIKRFLEPLKEHRGVTFTVLFHTIFWSFGWLLLLYFNKQIAVATELADSDMVIRYVWYFIILTILSYISIIFLEKFFDFIFWKVQRTIYIKYLNKTVELDNNAFETIGTWYFNSVLQRWWDRWSQLLKEWLIDWVSSCIEIFFAFILIYNASWLYGTLFAFIALVVSIIVMNWGTRISMPWRRKKRKIFWLMDKQTVRIIMSKFEILLNSRIDDETKKLYDWREDIMKYHNFDWTWILIAYVIPRFSNEVLRGLVYLFVWLWVIAWKYSIADYILLITVIELFRWSIISLVSIYRHYAKDFLYVTRLWNMFDTIPTMKGIHEWDEFKLSNADIKVESLSYSYKQLDAIETIEWTEEQNTWNSEVFDDFSIEITWWNKTAFVWVSWSWKSTLIKLIAWYLRPDSWSILVDGQDLTKVSLKSYYKHIGYLTQEPSVFDGTIIDNLTYAIDGEVDQEKLTKCIKLAKCEFIYDFPKWVDTEIGERGIRLSWGQRQRLAIAKIFLKDPKIIILDEPTSALDSFSEEAITEAMHNLFENRTVLIIAHRLQTVKNADDILVLDQGKVIERWTHDKLVSKWGEYAKMLELQSWF